MMREAKAKDQLNYNKLNFIITNETASVTFDYHTELTTSELKNRLGANTIKELQILNF